MCKLYSLQTVYPPKLGGYTEPRRIKHSWAVKSFTYSNKRAKQNKDILSIKNANFHKLRQRRYK